MITKVKAWFSQLFTVKTPFDFDEENDRIHNQVNEDLGILEDGLKLSGVVIKKYVPPKEELDPDLRS